MMAKWTVALDAQVGASSRRYTARVPKPPFLRGGRRFIETLGRKVHMVPNLIYDVGMHNGDDTAYYRHLGYTVVAIDANPRVCENARERFQADIEGGLLMILNVGITKEPGVMDFWICETHSEWSSFHREVAAREQSPHQCLPVPCRTFDSILEQYGIPYYLKVDIEGNDMLCIEALQTQRERPPYVSLEVGSIDESVTMLSRLGYTGFKCISQFHYLPLQLPPIVGQKRAEFWGGMLTRRDFPRRVFRKVLGRAGRQWMARRYACLRHRPDWTFPSGASGPFGEDTQGRWLTGDEVCQVYHHYESLRQRGVRSAFWSDQGYSFWTDLHARRDR
jgi:FkbM family methyltransferase